MLVGARGLTQQIYGIPGKEEHAMFLMECSSFELSTLFNYDSERKEISISLLTGELEILCSDF